jgi:heme-degrading monooxygenase HmoA
MNLWKFLLGSALSATFAVQPALAAGPGGNIIEVVTFKLKAGVSAAEFAPIDKAVGRDHVAKQPGFVSRESAHGADGEWLVIVHWRSTKDADASMASFEKAPAAAPFMAKIEVSTMSMKRFER